MNFLEIVLSYRFRNRTVTLALYSLFVIFVAKPIYGTTDDKILAGFVDGSYTGDFEFRSIFIQPIINFLLLPFYLVLPNFGWYSIFQILVVIIALGLISKEINKIQPSLNIVILAISVVIIGWLTPQPTFTSTSILMCLLGALLLVLCAHRTDPSKWTVFFTFNLLLFSYFLRPEAFLGTSAFLLIPMCFHFKEVAALFLKNFKVVLSAYLLIFSINFTIDYITKSSEWIEYENWNNYRHQIQNRVSQDAIINNIKDIGWSIPEHNLFVDLSYGDPSTFNTNWIKPAFDITRPATNISGLLNADFYTVSKNIFTVLLDQRAYVLGILTLSVLSLLIFGSYKLITYLVFSWMLIIFVLYFMSSTLHTPERVVVPLLVSTLIIQIILSLKLESKNLFTPKFTNTCVIISILLVFFIPKGFWSDYLIRKSEIDAIKNVKESLEIYNGKFIILGSVGTEVNHLTNPYYRRSPSSDIKLITVGNWETFSPHWFKRNENNGITSRNVYQELISNTKTLWITKEIPDTSYSIELYLRERGINNFIRTGLEDNLENFNIYQFVQK